jgi:nicotinate-nucleotide adenylyltransferase
VSPNSSQPVSQRIGLLGGTFDPIHLGHLILAEEARLSLSLDRVLFIPAGTPWRKAGREISPAADRLTMVSRAIASNPSFEVSRVELNREGPTYTVDTLQTLRMELGEGVRLWFILGADALLDLPHWKDPARILAAARLAVAAREGSPALDLSRLEALIPGLRLRLDYVPMPGVGVSSSELRRRLSEGISTRYWLPAEVERYAREHRLYARRRPSGVAAGTEL